MKSRWKEVERSRTVDSFYERKGDHSVEADDKICEAHPNHWCRRYLRRRFIGFIIAPQELFKLYCVHICLSCQSRIAQMSGNLISIVRLDRLQNYFINWWLPLLIKSLSMFPTLFYLRHSPTFFWPYPLALFFPWDIFSHILYLLRYILTLTFSLSLTSFID